MREHVHEFELHEPSGIRLCKHCGRMERKADKQTNAISSMSETPEVPDDIMKAAEQALDNLLCNCRESCGGTEGMRAASIKDIAHAILSDRNRSKWQDVRGYEGRYQVSSVGEVRKADGSPVGQWPSRYIQVRLSGPRRVVSVHRLVAEAFLPNPLQHPVVNHIDCNPHNNSVENLEWCTQAKNLEHSRRLGRVRSDHNLGVRSANARLNNAQVLEIRRIYAAGMASYSALALQYGMSKRAIGRIVSGETYADL